MKKIIILILWFVLCLFSSCSKPVNKENYTFFAMDTIISISFYNVEDSKSISKEVEKIYYKYDEVANDFKAGIREFNVFDLNEKREGTVSVELKELIEFAMEMKEDTKGYLNPFIGRLSHLWKEALKENKMPSDETIQKELDIMKSTTLEIDNLHIKLIGQGNLDLGSIAKGYATSKAKEYLDSIGCKNYLLNAGSSNLVLGSKDTESFTVGLSKALKTGYFYTLEIKEKAIATSSIKEQHTLMNGKYYSHLLNPWTGYPAQNYETLSIIGDDSKVLDAYSTACFAMELEQLKQFLGDKNLEYILSKENRLFFKSEGVDAYA